MPKGKKKVTRKTKTTRKKTTTRTARARATTRARAKKPRAKAAETSVWPGLPPGYFDRPR